MSNLLLKITKILLFLTLLTPLIVVGTLPYPFVFGKMLFYRAVVEVALVLFLIYLAINFYKSQSTSNNFNKFPGISINFRAIFKNRLFILILGFFIVSAGISTLIAPVFFKSFFGEIERGEGFLAYLHYFVFLVIALALFEKRDWFRFMKVAVGVGILVSLLAWLQFLGVGSLPLGLKPLAQPGSSLGNAAYLGSYLILLLAFITIILREGESGKRERLMLYAEAFFFIATIFITAIRGAILGLTVGALASGLIYVFSRQTPQKIRRGGIALVIFIVLFALTFWLTRSTGIWDKFPGLNRFSRVTFEIPSVSTRLIGLGVSFNAWKDKPIFGWGIEHYNIAYNANYNPAYEYYAEEWFDRAHNKIAEVAVIQGTFGLLLYLGILGATLWLTRRHPLVFGAFLAYVVQNLFLFDTPTSYLLLFPLWSYLIAKELEEKKEVAITTERKAPPWLSRFVFPVSLVIIIVIVIYHLYSYVYIPVRQAKAYRRANQTGQGAIVLKASDKFFYPYNYLQPTLRAQLIDKLFDGKHIRNKDFRPLVDRALAALEETAEREKYEPRQYIRLGENYNELAKDEAQFFEKALPFVERARELAPKRQGGYHLLAFTLSGLGRFDDAVETTRQSVALEPRNYKAYYNLGLNAALAAHAPQYKDKPKGEEYKKEALSALDHSLELAAENDYLFFSRNDFENLKIIYTRLGAYRRAAELLEIALSPYQDGRPRLTKEKQVYIDAITLYRELRDAEGMIRVTEKLGIQFPELAKDAETIIDLVRKGEWEILDTL